MKILAYIRAKLAKPFQGKQLFQAGAQVSIASRVVTKTLGTFLMVPPDPVSLSLNDAQNFIDRALKIKDRMSKYKSGTVYSKKYTPEQFVALGVKNTAEALKLDPEAEVVFNINADNLYSFIQSGADAAISLMTGIESFVNIMIPQDHKEIVVHKGVSLEKNKEEIIRHFSTEAKLEILARLKGKTAFKSETFWTSYLKSKKLRDDFVHFKTANAKIDSMWNPMVVELVDSDLQKLFDDSVALIQCFKSDYFD